MVALCLWESESSGRRQIFVSKPPRSASHRPSPGDNRGQLLRILGAEFGQPWCAGTSPLAGEGLQRSSCAQLLGHNDAVELGRRLSHCTNPPPTTRQASELFRVLVGEGSLSPPGGPQVVHQSYINLQKPSGFSRNPRDGHNETA